MQTIIQAAINGKRKKKKKYEMTCMKKVGVEESNHGNAK